jgi:hypothetical protein
MGRTKKTPVAWQDHHNEGAFRSTWTSQANPELFNVTGDKISTAGAKLSNKGKGPDRHEPVGVKVKSADGRPPAPHETVLKDIKEYGSSGTPGSVVSSH